MNETISDRQLSILRCLHQLGPVQRREIAKHIPDLSRITLIRDLNILIKRGLVAVIGRGPATSYGLTPASKDFQLYNPAVYLAQDPSQRGAIYTTFDSRQLKYFSQLPTKTQLKRIQQAVKAYQMRTDNNVAKRELERFIIEFSWKSSKIEGNTYTLLDTEQLLKYSVKAPGHSQQEARMIANHKTAFDYTWEHRQNYRQLSRSSIEDIHQLLVGGLGISSGLRRIPVGITGTVYRPPASRVELEPALDQLVALVNSNPEPATKALVALVGLSYLQPFGDGNKRTARVVSNALLAAYDYPPLSYRDVDEKVFKGALILFYEQGSVNYICDLFVEQLQFAARNYSLLS